MTIAKLEKAPPNHTWRYCTLCECEMVICGTCGNNCCNGGSGEVDGKPCPDCDSAYAMQYERWEQQQATREGRPMRGRLAKKRESRWIRDCGILHRRIRDSHQRWMWIATINRPWCHAVGLFR